MEITKKCTKCGKELPLDRFGKRKFKSGNVGRLSHCRDCKNTAIAKWQSDNPDKVKAYNTKWRKNNPEKSRAIRNNWRKRNPEKAKNIELKWVKNNPIKHNEKRARYKKRRRTRDLDYKLMTNIRAAMNSALRYNTKAGHTIELLGCSMEYLRTHLENQFAEGMTWGNYGRYGWHIDHIIPVSYFDHSDPEQQRRCWHYTNLQPLWAKDNLSKGNKIQ